MNRLTIIILLLLSTVVHAEWIDVPTVHDSGHGGVFGEVQDRLQGLSPYRTYRFDVWCHEDTHRLNNKIHIDGRGMYLPGGRALVVPSAGLTIRQVRDVIPRRYRQTNVYRLYCLNITPPNAVLVGVSFPSTEGDGTLEGNPALTLFGELSAYTTEAVASWERGQDPRKAMADASWLSFYCAVVALHLREQGYSHWEELHDFSVQSYAHLKQLRSQL